MTQVIQKWCFEILESHSHHTLIENEDKNSHLQTSLQLIQFYEKTNHSVDIIYCFGPNLKSQEKKKYSLSQCPDMNKVKFQLLIIYYCMLLLPLLIYFLQAYNIFHGLGGNDAIMYKDWSSKPLVIYSELHEP